MKNNILVIILFFGLTNILHAQFGQIRVGIPGTLNPGTVLDVDSPNKGVVFPRINLTSTNVSSPLINIGNAITIFNTATTSDVTPGYYYWSTDNSRWIRLLSDIDEKGITTDNIIQVNGGNTLGNSVLADASFTIANESITALQIKNGEVKTDELANKSVTAEKLNAGLGTANRVATSDVLGNVTYTDLSTLLPPSNAITKIISGTNTTVTGTGTLESPYKVNTPATVFSQNTISGDIEYINELGGAGVKAKIKSANANNILKIGTDGGLLLSSTDVLTPASANNGLTITNGVVQLGGALIKPTTIISDATNTLAINGLPIGERTDNVVVSSINGVLKTTSVTNLIAEPWQVQGSTVQATQNTQNIYQSGTVAIGSTTIPSFISDGETITPKLHVVGDVAATGRFFTNSSVYADYVFDYYLDGFSNLNKDYKLKTLKEVEKFIRKNKHLPGVTSIKEVAKNDSGYAVDMTTLTMQSLEKLEELYLYVIDQQKMIDEYNKETELIKQDSNDLKARLEKLEKLLLDRK